MIKNLLKFFKLSTEYPIVPKKELLTDSIALKHFANMWDDHKADTMMMLATVEYEYLHNNRLSSEEVAVLQGALGHVGLFLKDCKKEYDLMLERQMSNQRKMPIEN